MRPGSAAGGNVRIAWPKPGKALIAIIAANFVLYVLELLFIRANLTIVDDLTLRPSDVFERGLVWQPFTYLWLHDPQAPFHLIFNMVLLWMFGTRMEKWWGTRRFVFAYVLFGLGGGALTLIVALLSKSSIFAPLLGDFWYSTHLGASGAVVGMVVACGITFAKEDFHFLFIGQIKGSTLVIIFVALDLLYALSLSPVSSTSHFGGMAAAFILTKGLWRPGKWARGGGPRRDDLLKQKKALEEELMKLRDADEGEGSDEGGGGNGHGGNGGTTWN